MNHIDNCDYQFRQSMNHWRLASWCLLFAVLASAPIARADGQPAVNDPESGKLLSDSSGRITEVLLHYDEDLDPELGLAYRGLFDALGDGVKIRVLCGSDTAGRFFADQWRNLATSKQRDVDVINVGMKLSIWSRDRCIPRTNGGIVRRAPSFVPTGLPFYEYEKQNDLRTHRMLYRGLLGPSVLRSWLQLEGGNVIANDKLVFIGANVMEENDCDPNEPQLVNELNRVCGRPWMLVGGGSEPLPWDHIDMYMTPIGQDTVIVADAAAGKRFLTAHCDESGEGSTSEPQAALDEIANQMRKAGYRVLRVPAVFDANGDWVMTYNNVLMDERAGKRTVIMPTYNIPEMDRTATEVYAKLGFDVKPVDITGVYEFGGAIRCIVNVLDRSTGAPMTRDPRKPETSSPGTLRLLDVSSFVPRRMTRVYGKSEPELEPGIDNSPISEPMTHPVH